MTKSTKTEFGDLARILVLIGGVLLVVLGFLSVIKATPDIPNLGVSIGGSLFGIIVGLVALWGHRYVRELVWAVIFIVLGWFTGGIGGILVLLGGLIGLLTRFV